MSDRPVPYDLEQFFGAYFHQDWPLEADDWHGIVALYSASSTRTPEQLRALAAHVDELRASRPDDSELHAVMMKMGGFYDPRPQMTYKEWLGTVAERLRLHAAAIESGNKLSPP